jgi:acyl-CoA synthetase (AMP-forming)/AMP-acid ligase II
VLRDVLFKRNLTEERFGMTGTPTFVDLVGPRAGVRARAKAVAVGLVRRGLVGHRVLVVLPPGAEYVATLLGCLYAGVVAVPVAPGSRRLDEIVDDAQPAAVIGERVAGLDHLRDLDGDPRDWRRPDIGPDTLAILQYPNGPLRGVMLSHANLVAATMRLIQRVGMRDDAGVVSYLPPYSDLGLVGGVLAPMITGARVTLLPADTTPGEWLRMVSLRRARISFAPDLAYAWHVVPPGLELSHWDVAVTGARVDTLERFANLLAPHGFRRQALFPAYCLPEATALVAGRRGLVASGVDADTLEPGRLVKPGATQLLDLGAAGDIVIVDPLTATRCPDGTAGEVWVAGPNVAVGYLGRPEASEQTFCARLRGSTDNYLRTGHFGFLRGGALHLAEPQNVLLTR